MAIEFYKYEGAGNDFVVIDNRNGSFDRSDNNLVKNLCDRRFGVGADGLMLLQNHEEADFEMVYFNADGFEGSMCGNGGRCIAAFAHHLNLTGSSTSFMAVDGVHEALVLTPDHIRLKMTDVPIHEKDGDHYFLDTGSPHYVVFTDGLDEIDVYTEGRKIRYSERFRQTGTNVNFVEPHSEFLSVRTYERGVENETLACGTGVVASAISAALAGKINNSEVVVHVRGGSLKVSFDRDGAFFSNVWLEGPARKVFEGVYSL